VQFMDDDDAEMLANWADAACAELGIDWEGEPGIVLGLAADAARGVSEPAGTISAFLLGLAVGHGHPIAGAAVRIRDLAGEWERGGG
jgi:hypothetical protein